MKMRALAVAICVSLLAPALAYASDQLPQEIIGVWDYASFTIPSGARVHFKPGQWTLTLNADATWVMRGPVPSAKPANGMYEVHGRKLKMTGGNDLEYHFSLKSDGRVLELKNKDSTIIASRE
jgi:hypothetical protein